MYKVLIIDDEQLSREVIKALGRWDNLNLCVIGEAEDGTQGLKLIEELKPQIVITDMRMPGIEGVELLKIINKQFPSIKIIVMSGYDDFVYLKQAIRSKATNYLLKPISPEELNASLEQCVKELMQAKGNVNISLQTPPVFLNTKTLGEYLSYREQIYAYLLELNKAGIFNIFEKLRVFLEITLKENIEENILAKICYDFFVMLEEFIYRNQPDFGCIWNNKKYKWTLDSDWFSISKIIEDISRFYGETIEEIKEFHKNRNRINLTEVQEYIDRHFHEPISLETIAQYFFVSKEYLSRFFKTNTGENISDYILRKRMEKARELIVEQRVAIKHVANMMGYGDLAYFYKVFKKYFGITPGELRRRK